MNRAPSIASLSEAKLTRALLDHCRWEGLSWGDEAALRLLIAQGFWLGRGEFRRHVTVEIRHHPTDPASRSDSVDQPVPDLDEAPSQWPAGPRIAPQVRLEAWVDWAGVAEDVDHSPASRAETALLRLACHLAGHLSPAGERRADWALAEILLPLDATTALLATRAVAMAAIGPDAVGPLQ